MEHAIDMYTLDLESTIQREFDNGGITIVPTTEPKFQPYIDLSLNFRSYISYACFSNYWGVRTTVCGLILHLLDLFPVMPSSSLFDYDEVVANDLQCAKYTLMSAQYIFKRRTSLPLDYIRHTMPLQTAFCTFERMEDRAGGRDSLNLEAEHARRMQEFCVLILRDIVPRCGVDLRGFTHSDLARRGNIFTGKSSTSSPNTSHA